MRPPFIYEITLMAGDAGVEPALPEPESDVLPLDESPVYWTFDIIHHLYKILSVGHIRIPLEFEKI